MIGLNLCPFAESVYRGGRVRFHVSEQRSASGLLEELRVELAELHAADPLRCETTLLIHPWVLTDFIEYNDFLDVCEATIAQLDLEGELQVASFHPQYQFSGTGPADIENFTNRSPYPMLHLLREASIERAIAGGVDARLDVWMGMPHGFVASIGTLKASALALDAIGEFLAERLQP